MIGLLDYDWCVSNKNSVLIPNIEIMKLATYYKTEKNQFCRLLTLEDQELSSCDKIYFFSELNKNPQIPEHYLRAKNVFYGGTAFTNGVYIPFEEEIIDYTIPKPFIYKEFLKQKYNDGVKARVISHVLDDTYYRNYAGENKLPLPAILPRKRVYLYDRDFFYDDWQETLTKISERSPASIVRIHPIVCRTLTEYFTLRSFQKFSRANEIILDLNIPLDEIYYMLKKYKNQFLADITQSSNIYIVLGGSWPTQMLYFRDFIYKLNLLFSFWSCGIMIKIKFEEPNLGFKNPLINLSQLAESVFNIGYERKKDYSLNSKIDKIKKNNFCAEEKKLLLKFHPSAKDLFDQSFNKIVKEGRWRI